jgi:hypothetical protein
MKIHYPKGKPEVFDPAVLECEDQNCEFHYETTGVSENRNQIYWRPAAKEALRRYLIQTLKEVIIIKLRKLPSLPSIGEASAVTLDEVLFAIRRISREYPSFNIEFSISTKP